MGDAVTSISRGFEWRRKAIKVVLSLTLALLLFVTVLPRTSKAPWVLVQAAVGNLTVRQVLALGMLWFLGLYAHSFVLTAAMPRLSHRRALTLNLTGSAVSNVLPLGGAVGIGLNRHMICSWGFSSSAFTIYTLISNLWDVLAKLSLPAVALLGLLVAGNVTHPQVQATAAVTLSVLVVLLGLVGVGLWSERTATRVSAAVEHALNGLFHLAGAKRRVALVSAVQSLRRDGAAIVARNWVQLSLGMIAYCALQSVLLWSCLHLLGSTLPTSQVFAGYALERVLTIAAITPGGAGLVEVGITSLLVAFGGSPVGTVGGVLLYRAFTFGLEIPVGAVGLAVWLWHHRGRHHRSAAVPSSELSSAA